MLKPKLLKIILSCVLVPILLISGIGPVTVFADDYPGVPEEYHALLDDALARAGTNRAQWESALANAVGEEKEGVAFLIAYMRPTDLTRLTGEYILNHVRLAYQARNHFAWAKDIPIDIFLNNVLPFDNANELRVDWRGGFYERFAPYVEDCTTYQEAMTIINKVVRAETGVTFSTARRVANADPLESIQLGLASCSGLSIVLIDALRSVGLPARFAGNRQWFDDRGNHSWVEIWIDGDWHFTEYDPSQYGLDRAWFEHSAGRAEFGSAHGIFAVSYKPTGTNWPSSQTSADTRDPINAIEVTQRYLDAYQKALADEAASGDYVTLTVKGYVDEFHTTPADRRVIGFDVWEGPNVGGELSGQRSGGRTLGPATPEDSVFQVNMRKNRVFRVLDTNSREVKVVVGDKPVEAIIYSVIKADLKAAIDEANGKVQAEYSAASWAALTTALTTANTRFDSTSSTQSQVNTARTSLVSALTNLVRDKYIDLKIAGGAAIASYSYAVTDQDREMSAVLAKYDPEGRLVETVYDDTLAATAGNSVSSELSMPLPNGYTAKAFLWDLNFVPLAASKSVNLFDGVPEEYHALIDDALVRAGNNRAQWESALLEAVGEEKEGVAFLIAYMRPTDLTRLTGAYILNHVRLAYQARNRFAWAQDIPKDIFLNNVLPFDNANELRVDWRSGFYERFTPYVKDCTTYQEAMTVINRFIRAEAGVTFSTARRVANADPLESMQLGLASCSGLSIVLIDALRSVGLPARFAGNRQWFDDRGNHSWVEIWIDGDWHFTEYDPSQYGLDRAWFEHSAGRAEFGSTHGIFAVSYKPTGTNWPASQTSADTRDPINAIEVTQRYLDAYQKALADEAASGDFVTLTIRGYIDEFHTTALSDRAKIGLDVWEGPNDGGELTGQRSGGTTAGPTAAADYVFQVNMKKNREYRILYTNSRELTVTVGNDPVEVVIYSVNKIALKDAIDQAAALVEADYTATSWASLTTALTTANTRFNSTSSTFAQVNTAATNLVNALANLVHV